MNRQKRKERNGYIKLNMHDYCHHIQMFTAGILNNVETMLFQRQAVTCNVVSMLKYDCI